MSEQVFKHYTVMKREVVDSLDCYNSDKIFVDCTLGGGGHSEEILKRISAVDTENLSVKEAYNFIEQLKKLANYE